MTTVAVVVSVVLNAAIAVIASDAVNETLVLACWSVYFFLLRVIWTMTMTRVKDVKATRAESTFGTIAWTWCCGSMAAHEINSECASETNEVVFCMKKRNKKTKGCM